MGNETFCLHVFACCIAAVSNSTFLWQNFSFVRVFSLKEILQIWWLEEILDLSD